MGRSVVAGLVVCGCLLAARPAAAQSQPWRQPWQENAVVLGANFRALRTSSSLNGLGFAGLVGWGAYDNGAYWQVEIPVNYTVVRYYAMTEVMAGGRIGGFPGPQKVVAPFLGAHLGGASDGHAGYFTGDLELGLEFRIVRWFSLNSIAGLQAASCGAGLCAFVQAGGTFRIPLPRTRPARGY